MYEGLSLLKQNIFGCLVDFQKAFDSVPRNKLFQKLLDYNINGKFYDCLTNLYTGDKSCVKLGDRVTSTFELTHGVKQGCILSPILFNIFLSDLQQELEQKILSPSKYQVECGIRLLNMGGRPATYVENRDRATEHAKRAKKWH